MSATPTMTGEAELLLAQLRSHRRHVVGILEGLDEAALRRRVLPSGWSCLSLVNHLALDDERFWFRGTVAGEREVVDEVTASGESGWTLDPDDTVESVFARYREEAARTDAIVESTPLDTPPAWWPDFFGDYRLESLREVLLHVISETAVHAGHLDVVRELIDGRTWLILE